MQKMKKSKNKPRTQRSIEMEEERNEIIRREQEKEEMKKNRTTGIVNSMFCLYSAAIAVMSWLFDYMGILAMIAMVLGVIGYRRLKEKKGRDYYGAMAGMILAGLRLAVTLFDLIRAL
jgi:hypothetical protein